MHSRLRLTQTLAFALVLTALLSLSTACNQEPTPSLPGKAKAAAPETPQANPPALSPRPADAPVDAAIIALHLQNMITIGRSTLGFCDEQVADLKLYLELADADFTNARDMAFAPAEREKLALLYREVGTVAGRCLQVQGGREISERLLRQVSPLTQSP